LSETYNKIVRSFVVDSRRQIR